MGLIDRIKESFRRRRVAERSAELRKFASYNLPENNFIEDLQSEVDDTELSSLDENEIVAEILKDTKLPKECLESERALQEVVALCKEHLQKKYGSKFSMKSIKGRNISKTRSELEEIITDDGKLVVKSEEYDEKTREFTRKTKMIQTNSQGNVVKTDGIIEGIRTTDGDERGVGSQETVEFGKDGIVDFKLVRTWEVDTRLRTHGKIHGIDLACRRELLISVTRSGRPGYGYDMEAYKVKVKNSILNTEGKPEVISDISEFGIRGTEDGNMRDINLPLSSKDIYKMMVSGELATKRQVAALDPISINDYRNVQAIVNSKVPEYSRYNCDAGITLEQQKQTIKKAKSSDEEVKKRVATTANLAKEELFGKSATDNRGVK